MSTTTIRLPDELKARVAVAAETAGTSAHGFILEAIAEKTAQSEQQRDFHAAADRRDANIAASGKTMAWADMRAHLQGRPAGKAVARPAARKLAR